ncbi:carbohydrate ABC transporter permease [Actinomycetospora chiangmaiensis]|uniref:carbohydrate ABC transporter permease n=1 Tax=Actinomycetospora chiangmaiensis TaxID=402650 RepID=UPI000372C980|nr:sugar ABC transporter permease [Actinomycetospora chiangmaiensis]
MTLLVEVPAPAAPAPPEPATVGRRRLPRRLRALAPYLYLAPALALLVVWTYRPLLQAVQLSTYSWNLLPTSPATEVGLANFREVLSAPELGDAVGVTMLIIVGMLPFTIVVPVVVALLARQVHGRARSVYQALVFAPMLVAPVASAAVWQWLLDPSSGAVNRVLGLHVNWLADANGALVAIIVITGWHVLGFATLIVSAGLTGVDDEYAAAAAVDGARPRQITWRITLPLLSPTLVFLTLMTVLLSAQWSFPLIDTLTQGGPGTATTNIYYLLWEYGFRSFDAGHGAAAGLVFFVVFLAVAWVLVTMSDRLSFHDD